MSQKTNLDIVVLMCLVVGIFAGCDESNNGLKLHCEDSGASIDVEFKLCRENPKASIAVDVLGLHFEKKGDTTLDIQLGAFGSLELSLTSEGSEGDVAISITLKPLGIPVSLFKKTLRDPNCNVVIFWFNSAGIPALIGIGVAALLLLIGCCCCCYCCCCRRKPATGNVIIMQPGANGFNGPFNPHQSSVPYARQVNEA